MDARMKNMALAALCLSLAACQRMPEEPFCGQTTLTATLEEGPQTKTAISPAGEHVSSIIWTDGDELSVFLDNGTQAEPFKLVEGAGTTKGVFHGKGEGSSYTAFYPSSMLPSRSGNTLRFTLPFEQTFTAETFSPGVYPMVAVSGSPELHFRNLGSVIRLSVTGRHPVTRIVFRSNDASVKVSGKASASLSDPANPVLTMMSGACDSLALSVPRVKLDETKATDFFLVVPAQTYKGGFTVRVYTDNRYMDKVYSSDFTTVRSQIHKADPFVFQPNGLDTSTFLEGRGTESDPFLIQSISDLILLRNTVNAGASIPMVSGAEVEAASASYLLTTDIDLSPVCSKKSGKSWSPIGDVSDNGDRSFNGVFNGNGHAVTNLYIHEDRLAYRGLFGQVKGVVRNLTVSGDVTSSSMSGILAGYVYGNGSLIENCVTKGSVYSSASEIGGLMGIGEYATVEYCRNEATVEGFSYVGGIAGYSYFVRTADHCTNIASVKGRGDNVGGVLGYMNGSKVFNGYNSGAVSGRNRVGGVGGYLYQGGKILNSINSGEVTGSDYVGGVGGFVSSKAIAYQGPGTVANCIQLGKVQISGGTYGGTLAGFAGLTDDDSPLGDEPISGAWVKNSYWLRDNGSGMKDLGGGPGIAENNFALTDEQMKGAAYDGVLFTETDGTGYDRIIDALNAGAVLWGKNTPVLGGESRDHFPLSGWEQVSPQSYPSLSDLEARSPGGGKEIFFLSGTEFGFNAVSGSFQVDVTSSLDYSLGSLPAWIRKTEEKTYANKPHTKSFLFGVEANPGTQERSATLTFTNTAGTVLKVSVRQEGMYIQLGKEELVFTGEESSLRFAVSSSVAWHAESDADWCTLPGAVGVGNGLISVHVSANPDKTARTATITVSSDDGSLVRTVKVLQSGAKEGDVVDWTTAEFVHKSLAMRFTATWCGWCPRMNKSILKAQELLPGKISYVALHNNDSDLAFSQIGPLRSQYGINAFPSGIVDGRTLISNQEISVTANNIINVVKETEQTYGTVTGVDINSSVSGRLAQVDVNVYVKKAGEYKITVLLLEDGIINAQSDYEEGDHARYVHDNVARVAMTDVTGNSFRTDKDFEVTTLSFSANVPASFNLANMRVLVYVQRAFGSMPVIQSGNYGGYYVDNSADVPLGENLKLALEGGGGGGGSSSGGGGNEGIVPGDDINM